MLATSCEHAASAASPRDAAGIPRRSRVVDIARGLGQVDLDRLARRHQLVARGNGNFAFGKPGIDRASDHVRQSSSRGDTGFDPGERFGDAPNRVDEHRALLAIRNQLLRQHTQRHGDLLQYRRETCVTLLVIAPITLQRDALDHELHLRAHLGTHLTDDPIERALHPVMRGSQLVSHRLDDRRATRLLDEGIVENPGAGRRSQERRLRRETVGVGAIEISLADRPVGRDRGDVSRAFDD